MIIDPYDPLPRPRAILLIVGFCVAIAIGPVCWFAGARVHTRATPPAPAWETRAVLDGDYTKALEKHIVESSPVTLALRGAYRDAWMGLGLLDTGNAVLGRGGQLFFWYTLQAPAAFARDRAARRALLAGYRARCEALGVRLVLVPVPDTASVLPELLPEGFVLPESRRRLYADLAGEAREAGIETVDLLEAMRAWRRARPEETLYQARDTHWTLTACQRAAELVAQRLTGLGWLDAIPRASLRAQPAQERPGLGDLAEQTGLAPDGAFGSVIRDRMRWIAVFVRDANGGERPLATDEPDAAIAVAGDSFADIGFVPALCGHLGRLVDASGVLPAGGPRSGLEATLMRIERGELRVRVIVWEAIERSWAEDWWHR
ncbi:MAG: hypothetical protein HZB39_04520 [Planctomycetes bacterium]|nr:hypothetical protein [Planctomycetota bacterium]